MGDIVQICLPAFAPRGHILSRSERRLYLDVLARSATSLAGPFHPQAPPDGIAEKPLVHGVQ